MCPSNHLGLALAAYIANEMSAEEKLRDIRRQVSKPRSSAPGKGKDRSKTKAARKQRLKQNRK